MKKMIDVISGKEDIVVKDIVAEDIVVKDIKITAPNGLVILRDNDPQYYKVSMLSTIQGFDVKIENDVKISYDDSAEGLKVLCGLTFYNLTTAQRPSSVYEGTVIYDSTLKKCILYNGTAWVNLDGTALA